MGAARPGGPATESYRVVLEPGGLIVATLRGHATERGIGTLHDEVGRQLETATRATILIFDATGIVGFDPSVRVTGVRLLTRVKQANLAAVGAAVRSSPVRMMAAAISLASGLSLRMHATLEEAIADAKAARSAAVTVSAAR